MKITLQLEDVSYLNAEPILSFASALEGDFFLIEEFSHHMLFLIDGLDKTDLSPFEQILLKAYLDFAETLRDALFPDRKENAPL